MKSGNNLADPFATELFGRLSHVYKPGCQAMSSYYLFAGSGPIWPLVGRFGVVHCEYISLCPAVSQCVRV